MELAYFVLFYAVFVISAKLEDDQNFEIKNKKKEEIGLFSNQQLPYFRRKVEETISENSVEDHAIDTRNKLIAFLVENVQEVFKDTDINLLNEFAENLEPTLTTEGSPNTTNTTRTSTALTSTPSRTVLTGSSFHSPNLTVSYKFPQSPVRTTLRNISPYSLLDSTLTTNTTIVTKKSSFELSTELATESSEDLESGFFVMENDSVLVKNFTLRGLPFLVRIPKIPNRRSDRETTVRKFSEGTKKGSTKVSKNLLFIGRPLHIFGYHNKEDTTIYNVTKPVTAFFIERSKPTTVTTTREPTHKNTFETRSCIFCNNVELPECTQPDNKIVPSILCENERDRCYSLHTPFGIVDRGCYNPSKNISTYVCPCNYCNSMSLNNVPTFETKREWGQNVAEISYSRRLKTSMLKELTCLSCEAPSLKKDELLDTDCLEGNINRIPSQKCKPKEICAIKSIKNIGYIWRGCIKSPLYNYWLHFCDSDLCNFDELVSVYDTD